jgi:hypothetical protein
VNLTQVNERVERITAIKYNVARKDSELSSQNIKFDLTGTSAERVVSGIQGLELSNEEKC